MGSKREEALRRLRELAEEIEGSATRLNGALSQLRSQHGRPKNAFEEKDLVDRISDRVDRFFG